MYPHLAFLILPYTRFELPGWGHLFRAFKVGGVEHYPLWESAPTKTIRDRFSKYAINLDLSNWSERHTYFLGRYYDLDLQLLMNQVLQTRDGAKVREIKRFVDIGANIGLISLHGASLVGNSGCVDSFEPNPECCNRIKETLKQNNINHVRLHQVGLSDQVGNFTLSVITEHSGMATFATPRNEDREMVSKSFEVPVLVGDDVIMENSTPVTMIKIDVEGFELRVLKGLQKTLSTWYPVIVTEVVKEWLNRAGTNRTEIYHYMKQFGYNLYGLTKKRKFLRYHLALIPISEHNIEDVAFTDFLWLHPQSTAVENLQSFINEYG